MEFQKPTTPEAGAPVSLDQIGREKGGCGGSLALCADDSAAGADADEVRAGRSDSGAGAGAGSDSAASG